MSMFGKLLPRNRVRSARKLLSQEPTARNYAMLAQEFAVGGELGEVVKVCEEGLAIYPGDRELRRLQDRARQLQREDKTRKLLRELKESPRTAVWRELCELYIESSQVERAEELAQQWFGQGQDSEAVYYQALARTQRFLTDRRRDDGRKAFDLIEKAESGMGADERPIRLRLDLASRCGVWTEARKAVARLLEMHPGDPALEARFRSVMSQGEGAKDIEHALREIEKTGRLVDDETRPEREATSNRIRPALQSLAAEPGVQAAVYVRGATALVQGPKGATAERTARSIREVVQSSRSAARRLGLGQPFEVRVQGDFGELLLSPGDLGSGAVWCSGPVGKRHVEALRDLAGLADAQEEAQ